MKESVVPGEMARTQGYTCLLEQLYHTPAELGAASCLTLAACWEARECLFAWNGRNHRVNGEMVTHLYWMWHLH